MAVTRSDDTTISSLLPSYYKKKWLKRHEANLVYDEWAQQEPIPMGSGRSIVWHALLNPAVGYILTEGDTPAASAVSARKVSATLTQYGDLKAISDVVDNSAICPVVEETVDALGYGGALTKDRFISDAIGFASSMSTGAAGAASAFFPSVFSRGFPVYDAASETVYWPDSSNKAAAMQAGRFSATPTIAHIRGAADHLNSINAVRFEDGNFRGIIHNSWSTAIRNDSLWPTWNAFSNRTGALVKGTLGVIEGVLFKESSEAFSETLTASAWSNLGGVSAGGRLYGAFIFGKGAFGVTKLAGKDVTVTVIPSTQKDKSDPLGQRAYVGYKFDLAVAILNPSAGVIIPWYKTN